MSGHIPSVYTDFIILGGVVKDQAEADKNLNWKQRVALGAGILAKLNHMMVVSLLLL